MKKFDEAKTHLLLGIQYARKTGSIEDIKFSYGYLSILDSALGDYASEFADYKMFILYRDSLVNEENTKKTVQLQMQYEFDKKESAAKAAQEKRNAIADADKKRKNIILISVAACLLLVVVFSVFLFNRFRITQRQKIIIESQKFIVEEKQKEIIDSIRYAKRIQESLFPTEKYILLKLEKLKEKNPNANREN
jgi:hypothetical protein